MKLKFRLLIVLLACVALTYTACKKSSSGPTLSAKAVSSQVALNIAQTLYNGFGVFSITDGLNAPDNFGLSRQKLALKMGRGLKVNDFGEDFTCGLIADTTLNYSETQDDVQVSVSGPIKFTFLCTNNVPSGFNLFDNLVIKESTSQFSGTFNLAENLTLLAVNPNNENTDIKFDGTVSLSDNITLKTGSKKSSAESYSYKYNSIIISGTTANISGGSATFATKGTNAQGNWDYSGTITFLGNNKVKIVINGSTYTVDLTTGEAV